MILSTIHLTLNQMLLCISIFVGSYLGNNGHNIE